MCGVICAAIRVVAARMIVRSSGGVSDVVYDVLGPGDLFSWAYHRAPGVICFTEAHLEIG
jgi:hypothetical protein